MSRASATQHEGVVSDYGDLWNGDFSKMDVVSESAAIYDPAAPDGEVHGRDAFEAYLRDLYEGFPDFHLTTHDVLTSDEIVMLDWTVTGTYRGEFDGVPPTGREMNVTGMSKLSIVDGKVQEDRLYVDQQEMFAQLGLTFPDIVFLLPKLVSAKLREIL